MGVQFGSYTEPYLITDNELASYVPLAVTSNFAEYEAKTISRRTDLAYNTVKKYLRRIKNNQIVDSE